MRSNLVESLVVGCGIALGVLLVHMLTRGAPATTQLLVLLIAGIVLFCIQLTLTLRRAHRGGAPPEDGGARRQHLVFSRRGRHNPFFRELTDDWIGLDDQLAQRGNSGPSTPDALDDELWGDLPDVSPRKAGAKVERQRRPTSDD